jgi:hypothetical protein
MCGTSGNVSGLRLPSHVADMCGTSGNVKG